MNSLPFQKDFTAPNPSLIDPESFQTSSEIVFSACDDNDEELNPSFSEELRADPPTPSPPPSSSSLPTLTTTASGTQDFDLVKNVLSEIFDKPDEEMLDENPIEEKESELVNIEQSEIPSPPMLTSTNEDDFRFLDEILASIDGSDADIHQLTPAEIDRVDNLLKGIVDAHPTEEAPPGTTTEVASSPPVEEIP